MLSRFKMSPTAMRAKKASSFSSTTGLVTILEELNNLEEPQIPTWKLVCLCISLSVGLFLSFLDTSIVATSIYTIGVEFHSLNKVTWVALAYTLSYLGCATLFASFADVIGRCNAYLVAAVIFYIFSVGCGLAQSLDQLIAFRVLQGVGGSGLYSIAMIIFPEISTLRMAKYIGTLSGLTIAMAGVLGPIFGGIITNYSSWRWIFFINAPIGIIPLIMFIMAWPRQHEMRTIHLRPLKQIDLLGSFLLIAASVLVVFSFQEGGVHLTDSRIWNSKLIIAPLVVGILCWIALFSWQWFIYQFWERSISAILPFRLLQKRVYLCGTIATMLAGYPYFVLIYFLPTHFQVVNGHTPLKAAISLLPMLGSTAVGSMIGGLLSGRRNNTFPVMLVASCLMLGGTAALTTLGNTSTPTAKPYGLQVLVGMGFGLTVSSSGLIAALESEIRDNAMAQGIIAQVRILGGSLGIAASTAIQGVQLRRKVLQPGIITQDELQSLRDSMLTFTPEQLFQVRQGYTDAFHKMMIVCSIICGVCVLVTLGLLERNPQTMEERRLVSLQNDLEFRETEERMRIGRLRVKSMSP